MKESFLSVKKKAFKLALAMSIVFAIGIPFFIVGVIYIINAELKYMGLAFLIVGLTLLLMGIIAIPNSWMNYLTYFKYERIIDSVNKKGLRLLNEISKDSEINIEDTEKILRNCLRKGYIGGFNIENEELVLGEYIEKAKEDVLEEKE